MCAHTQNTFCFNNILHGLITLSLGISGCVYSCNTVLFYYLVFLGFIVFKVDLAIIMLRNFSYILVMLNGLALLDKQWKN